MRPLFLPDFLFARFDPLMEHPSHNNSATNLLVVEDEEKTRASVVASLQLEGWRLSEASDGEEAIRMLATHPYDLVILDCLLPGKPGLEVLQEMRKRGQQTPVLMLSALQEVSDRVTGLSYGADDYLAKPFALAELVARCQALLRRPLMSSSDFLRCGDLQLDTRNRVAVRAGEQIPLTPREVDVLEYLFRYQGQIVTREMLERDVWKQTHRFTALDNVIQVHMMRLRKKVDSGVFEKLIHTVRGVGYSLGSPS